MNLNHINTTGQGGERREGAAAVIRQAHGTAMVIAQFINDIQANGIQGRWIAGCALEQGQIHAQGTNACRAVRNL